MEGADTGAIGKYRLIAELGHGGMAQVFLAVARGPVGFNKLVVIKQIREQLADDPEFLTMFLDEARLAARLNHPNVVQTNEVGEDGRRYFIAMEYLEGQPLNRLIQRAQKESVLPIGMYLRILIDALGGLHYAHELTDFDGTPLQVVHRDMTPHNIFVTYSGQVKVVDFGIAKALGSSAETRAGVLKGKVAYMAPEQAMGEKVDRRADIFSVGVMIWEALAGKRLFKGMNDIVVLQKIVNGQIPSPRTVKEDIPDLLEAICMRALAHDRDVRYATAADLASALEAALVELALPSHIRDAGKLVAQLFNGEQTKIKQLVEAQMTNIRMSGEFPAPDLRQKAALPIIDSPTSYDHAGDSGSIRSGQHRARPSGETPVTTPGEPMQSSSSLTANTSVPVLAPPAPAKNKMLAPAIALGLGAMVAIAVFAWPKGQPSADGKPAASAAEAPATRSLRIESTPPGATITENGQSLGKTPMAIPLDATQGVPRQFVVTLEGFTPYSILQPPTREDVRLLVPLSPAAPVAQAPAPPVATATAEPKAKAPPPPPVARPVATVAPVVKPPPMDINLSR